MPTAIILTIYNCLYILAHVTSAVTVSLSEPNSKPKTQSVWLAQFEAVESSKQLGPTFRYFDNYEVPAEQLKHKGGVSSQKSVHVLSGGVLVAMGLRRFFVDSITGQPIPSFNYDQLAVCQGHAFGLDLQNRSRNFDMFACPVDNLQAAEISSFSQAESSDLVQAFCCRHPPSQRCCNREDFYRERGTSKAAAALAMRLIVALAVIAASVIFGACISLIICLCIVLPRAKRPKPARYPGQAASVPLMQQQMLQQRYSATSSQYTGQHYPAPLPGYYPPSSAAGAGVTATAGRQQLKPDNPPPYASVAALRDGQQD